MKGSDTSAHSPGQVTDELALRLSLGHLVPITPEELAAVTAGSGQLKHAPTNPYVDKPARVGFALVLLALDAQH